MDSTCLSTMQKLGWSGAGALGDDRRRRPRFRLRVGGSRSPLPVACLQLMSPLGYLRGTLISTVSSGGGRLLPLPAARLRRHILTAIRAGRRFPRPSCRLGALSSPPPAAAFAVAGLSPPSARGTRNVVLASLSPPSFEDAAAGGVAVAGYVLCYVV